MNDRDLERLLRRSEPAAGAVVGSLDLERGEQELLEEIMSMPATHAVEAELDAVEFDAVEVTPVPSAHSSGRRASTRRTTVALAAAAALVAVVTGPALLFQRGSDHVVPAAPPTTRPAVNHNPHLLLAGPGWKLRSVLESDTVTGEMQWADGRKHLQLNWYAADLRQGYVDDRRAGYGTPTSVRVLGQDGALFPLGGGAFEVILPARGDTFVMMAGDAGDRAGFLAALRELHQVSEPAWLAALPDTVVVPENAASVARTMLKDIPLAPGYDPSTLPHGLSQNYDDYGATVVGSVTCAWFRLYETARTTGDEAGVARARQALESSSRWRVMRRMAQEGDYPWVVSQMVDRVSHGEPAGNFEQALGC